MSNKYLTCNDVFYNRTADLFKGFTQTQIAGMTGIAQSKIHDIIDCAQYPQKAKNKLPTIDIACKIAKAFDVTTDYLLGITDNKTTDKATQELCNTLGLSDAAIDILLCSKNYISTAEEAMHKIPYNPYSNTEIAKAAKTISETTATVFNFLAEDLIETIDKSIAENIDTSANDSLSLVDLLGMFLDCADTDTTDFEIIIHKKSGAERIAIPLSVATLIGQTRSGKTIQQYIDCPSYGLDIAIEQISQRLRYLAANASDRLFNDLCNSQEEE
jgi:plasmid maintenance system antidote protein VapI